MSFQNEFSADTMKCFITLKTRENKTNGYFKVTGKNMAASYDGNKLISLNLSDTTYTLSDKPISGQHTRTLAYWAQYIGANLKQPGYVKSLKDTLINNTVYSHTRITTYDAITNGQHCYTFAELLINKNTLLPYSITSKVRGIGGDGEVGGWVEEHLYSNYSLNPAGFPDLTITSVPANFKAPVHKTYQLLAKGTKAPGIKLYDAAGKTITLEAMKSKMVLLNFTGLGCPHCVNAVQLMNQLKSQYNDLVIISAYPFDKHDAIDKFDKKFAVKYLSYTTESDVKQMFPYDGIPTFYLIDKDGAIVKSYTGYYQKLKDEMVEQLNTMQ
ncbi:hypothetical protein GCM10023149_14690 [Mucilaginibacter gynuensis]|uniref:Thioredoxin domain-containing protein n=2 Tax=Mucilaginibacter gynuensis TaxID=1302236 RepID=A0ABP8G552_9SPHI